MEIKSNGITVEFTREEFSALEQLLGNMNNTEIYSFLKFNQVKNLNLISDIYEAMSNFTKEEQ